MSEPKKESKQKENQYARRSEKPHRYSDHDLRGSKPFKTFKALA
jgi:hypothetical protein